MTKDSPEVRSTHDIDIQWGLAKCREFPEDATMISWVETALAEIVADDIALSVRMMDRDEISALNSSYRNRHSPTNVLSFPAEGEDERGKRLMGDIAICTDVVATEAVDQDKALDAHMAHMLIHGVLHLAGYDHVDDNDAFEMERLEIDLLGRLGFPDPYSIAAPRDAGL